MSTQFFIPQGYVNQVSMCDLLCDSMWQVMLHSSYDWFFHKMLFTNTGTVVLLVPLLLLLLLTFLGVGHFRAAHIGNYITGEFTTTLITSTTTTTAMCTVVELLLSGDYKVRDGGLSDEYKAVRLEFHWSNTNKYGSEHYINDTAFPLEV